MKAVVFTQYGSPDVLQLREIEKPTPKSNEILIKIHATPVEFGDLLVRNMKAVTPAKFTMPLPFWLPTRLLFGFRKPRINILGGEFAGEVEAIGSAVKNFRVGDQVFAYRGPRLGANAEYLCMPEDDLVAIKPANMTFEEAATVPYGALTALSLLRKVDIQNGHKVLIIGASGSIGSYALQLAKHDGAQVTGVCGTPRVEMVKALGADEVIDYTTEDFTQSNGSYDLIFDVLGKSSFSKCKPLLKPNGVYLLASFKMRHLFQMLWTSLFSAQKVICALSNESREDLLTVKALAESGAIRSFIDRCYPLEQTAEAHRYSETGRKKGAVVIRVAQELKKPDTDMEAEQKRKKDTLAKVSVDGV